MKKAVILIILILAIGIVAAGCSKDDGTVRSKPVVKAKKESPEPATQGVPLPEAVYEEPAPSEPVQNYEEPEPVEEVYTSNGQCDMLSVAEVGAALGGSFIRESDCPNFPTMPKGVKVCMCSYNYRSVYANVETQKYDDPTEAARVYNMYCDTDDGSVGDKSCTETRSQETRPNFVYFLKGDSFVKVSCLGGSCPLSAVGELAKKIEAKI